MGTLGKQRYAKPFQQLVVAIGAGVVFLSAYYLPAGRLDWRFILLACITVVVSSRIAVKIPRVNTNITVSDTFIFLALLIYGGETAVLLAAAEGVGSGLRISNKRLTILFSAAVMACSTFATVCMLRIAFGSEVGLSVLDLHFLVIAVCVMALVQYVANTGIVAVALAFRTGEPVWPTWTKHYLWSSITYFVGAASAALIANFIDTIGFYAFVVAIPIVSIVYLTYYKYLEDIKRTAAQAEQAEHARAEAERERAEMAERNVEEQKRHIRELERISKQLQDSREHFRHAAFHDALTGLPNRALLLDHLRQAINRARREPKHLFAVLFLDLDRFKNINDSLGHAVGDELLVIAARRLKHCIRNTDIVARLGGDEFAILLDGLGDYSVAIRIAERVQRKLMQPVRLNGQEIYTTASIGIALSTIDYDQPENMLRDADTAMYHAKENGKARYEMFDSVMHASAVVRLQMENDLRRALERCEFEIYYQPIVSLETDQIAGFEALLRWHHPERGFVSPADFIPLAEETGIIIDLGHWVLLESCRQMRAWHTQLSTLEPLTISVNLSGKQFSQPDFISQIRLILEETELDPRCLKLEITESVMMDNAEMVTSMLTQLRDLGIQLSIDDFGTGYSSLSYLHRFPIDTLKIDRSFVGRMGIVDENSEIVRTIITLATNLGMTVIAEGIETHEQLIKLKALNCEYGQGYLFSRPVAASAIPALLEVKSFGRKTVPLLPGEPKSKEPSPGQHVVAA